MYATRVKTTRKLFFIAVDFRIRSRARVFRYSSRLENLQLSNRAIILTMLRSYKGERRSRYAVARCSRGNRVRRCAPEPQTRLTHLARATRPAAIDASLNADNEHAPAEFLYNINTYRPSKCNAQLT